MFETIVALTTPPLKSALAVIRVSGSDAFSIVSKCFTKDLTKIDKRTALMGYFKDNDEIIDQVVLVVYKGPRSFTGEDVVEIISHGSMLIVNEILTTLIKNGARQAERGEFSERAFLLNKLDLVQAEAVNDVINARTHEAKRLALLSLDGDASKAFLPFKEKIEDLICNIEVRFDFPEEADNPEVTDKEIVDQTNILLEEIETLIKDAEKGKIIKEGIKVAIVGKPNVGKSSLLNALLNENKAIVTDIAGTTRDVVEGDINLNGIAIHLLDTAGIRHSDDKIESIGIEKSKESINEADVVILLLDASKNIDEQDQEILDYTKDKLRLIVYNKVDMLENSKNLPEGLYISALNKNIKPLIDELFKVLGIEKDDFEHPSLANVRQIGLLNQIKTDLLKAREDAMNHQPIDLISVSLNSVYNKSLELLGQNSDIDIVNEIFSRFCVGK